MSFRGKAMFTTPRGSALQTPKSQGPIMTKVVTTSTRSPDWGGAKRRPPSLVAERQEDAKMYMEKFKIASKLVGEADLKKSLWRSLFRSDDEKDAEINGSDFVAAVRDGERCVRQALGSWSDRELRGLFAEMDERGVGRVSVDDVIGSLFGRGILESSWTAPVGQELVRRESSLSQGSMFRRRSRSVESIERLASGTISSDAKRISPSRSRSPSELQRRISVVTSPRRSSLETSPQRAAETSRSTSPSRITRRLSAPELTSESQKDSDSIAQPMQQTLEYTRPWSGSPVAWGSLHNKDQGIVKEVRDHERLQLGAKLNEALYALSHAESNERSIKENLFAAQRQIAQLDGQLASVLEENKRLLQALAAEEGDKEQAAEKLSNVSSQLKSVTLELHNATDGYARCEEERGRLESECGAVHVQLNSALEQLRTVGEGYAASERDRARLDRECAQLRTEQEEEREAHTNDVARWEKEVSRLEREEREVSLQLNQERHSRVQEMHEWGERFEKERRDREEELSETKREREQEKREWEEQVANERREKQEQLDLERREAAKEMQREREREKREREVDRLGWLNEKESDRLAFQREAEKMRREWERERDGLMREREEERARDAVREQRERQEERELWRKEVSERDAKARAEVLRIQKQVEELNEANRELQAALHLECEVRMLAQSTMEEQREALDKAGAQCEQLSRDLELSQERGRGQLETLVALRNEREGLVKNSTVMQAEIEVLKTKLFAVESERESMIESEARSDARIFELERISNERQRECADLGERLRTSLTKLELASETIAQMRDQLRQEMELRGNAENAELQTREMLMQAENVGDARLQDVKLLEGHRRDLADQLVALRRALEPRVKAAEQELKEERVKRESLQRCLDDSDKRLQAVCHELSTSKTELESSREAGRELRVELEKLMRTVAEQQAANLRGVKEKKSLLMELRAMEDRLQDNLNVLLAAEEAKAKLQIKLEEKANAYMKAREHAQEQEQWRIDEASTSQELRENIAVLKASVDTQQRASDRLREEVRMCAEKYGAAASRVEELVQQLRVAEERNLKLETESTYLRQQMSNVQQKYSQELERSIIRSRTIPAVSPTFGSYGDELMQKNTEKPAWPTYSSAHKIFSSPAPATQYRKGGHDRSSHGQDGVEGRTMPPISTPVQIHDMLRNGARDGEEKKEQI